MKPYAYIAHFSFALALTTIPLLAAEDRDNATPTVWYWMSGTPAEVATAVAGGMRIVDIRVKTVSPLVLTVALVENTGSYGKTWGWHTGKTGPEVATLLTTQNDRLVALDAYDDGTGTTKFAVAMIRNTGADNKSWWWTWDATPAGVANLAATNNARVVVTREYRRSNTTYYAAILLLNAGADSKSWWHWYGVSAAFLQNQITTTGGRMYDLSAAVAPGMFSAVIVQDSNQPKSWWYTGVTGAAIGDLCNNLGARVMVVHGSEPSYNVVLIDNLNLTARRTNDAMRAATDGWVGAYLKEANGPVLAAFNEQRVFEPASTIKTCIHLQAMRQVMQGNDSLTSNVVVYTGANGSCPTYTNPVNETLRTVLQKMMENSDNNRTLAAADRYGVATINSQNITLGFGGIQINHRIGCGGIGPLANRMTLVDIGKLHELVINGYLGAHRSIFYELMLEDPDGYGGLGSVLTEEASNVGLNAGQLAAFKGAMVMAYKGGSYLYLTTPATYYYSYGAYVSLPFYTSSGVTPREYVTGVFIDSSTSATGVGVAFNAGSREVLRDVVHEAMLTWKSHGTAYFASYGAGCKGTNNQIPALTATSASGEPRIGAAIQERLASARASSGVALYLGSSKTTWGSFLLPLSMAPYGMPTCSVLSALTVALPTTTNASGIATVSISIPNNAALLGGRVFSQFLVADLGANPLGIVVSNGLESVIGK